MTTLFQFELEGTEAHLCIPMSVRLNLDCCGLKVTTQQWKRLNQEECISPHPRLVRLQTSETPTDTDCRDHTQSHRGTCWRVATRTKPDMAE